MILQHTPEHHQIKGETNDNFEMNTLAKFNSVISKLKCVDYIVIFLFLGSVFKQFYNEKWYKEVVVNRKFLGEGHLSSTHYLCFY